jgi:hypothetical protein
LIRINIPGHCCFLAAIPYEAPNLIGCLPLVLKLRSAKVLFHQFGKGCFLIRLPRVDPDFTLLVSLPRRGPRLGQRKIAGR